MPACCVFKLPACSFEMDITTICTIIFCIGSLQTCSLYHVDGTVFQVPKVVTWSEAERTCQENNGKLFQPNETSFDVSLFSECNFNEDLWVGATYINIFYVGSAFRGDSFIRCEMCTTNASCGAICLHKACGDQCKVACKGLFGSQKPLLNYKQQSRTEANQWCSKFVTELGDKIQTASYLSRKCLHGCFWTKNMIQVRIQTQTEQGNEPKECGILHNGTLSFTSCNNQLRPLCERVATTTLETPRYYFSEGNNSFISINTKITSMTTTQKTNRIDATITTSSTHGTLSVGNDIEKQTTFGLKDENSSLLVPVGATTFNNGLDDSSKNSDDGIIIGAVVGSVVFLMLTVLGIICVRRKLLQRTFRSKIEGTNMNMLKTDATHKPINQYQGHDVPLESESGPFAQLESKCEGSRCDIVGQKSNPGKSAYTIEPKESNLNSAIVAKKVNVNWSNLTYQRNDDTYDHLNDIQQSRYDNVAGNVYDITNFDQRNDSTYDISGGHSKNRDEGVGLYDRVNTTICSEYDTTDDLRRDSNAAYDHI